LTPPNGAAGLPTTTPADQNWPIVNLDRNLPMQTPTGKTYHIHGTPVYMEDANSGFVFIWGENERVKAYNYDFATKRVTGFRAQGAQFASGTMDAPGGMPGGRVTFIALSILLFAVLGCVLEGLPAVVLFAPLMFPIARQFGVHEVHYSMIAILAMGVGLFTPPFGIGFYITCAIGGADPDKAFRHIWIYLAVLMIGVILVAGVPWLSVGFL